MTIANLPPSTREHDTDGKREPQTVIHRDQYLMLLADKVLPRLCADFADDIENLFEGAIRRGDMPIALQSEYRRLAAKAEEAATEVVSDIDNDHDGLA